MLPMKRYYHNLSIFVTTISLIEGACRLKYALSISVMASFALEKGQPILELRNIRISWLDPGQIRFRGFLA